MKKLIIFDLDGTLLNTIADLAQATNQALTQLQYPTHEISAYRYFVGNGINKLFERALPENARSEEQIQAVRALFLPYYDKHQTDLSSPYEGIPDLLQQLTERGYQLAVASNKYHAATTALIKHYFPNVDFCSILGQREQKPSKPHPQIVFDTIKTAGINLDETVYVGDSCVDMETGKNAGVTTVGVSWGFRPRTELESYQPDAIIDKPQQLLTFLSQLK